jgi:outer membrane protein TolC
MSSFFKPGGRVRLILTVAALLLLVGCIKVGPDYARPETKMAAAWQEADDQRVKSSPGEYRTWWRVFNDPTLDRVIEQA